MDFILLQTPPAVERPYWQGAWKRLLPAVRPGRDATGIASRYMPNHNAGGSQPEAKVVVAVVGVVEVPIARRAVVGVVVPAAAAIHAVGVARLNVVTHLHTNS